MSPAFPSMCLEREMSGCVFARVFVCLRITSEYLGHFYNGFFPPHVCFSIWYQKIFEVCGSISGWLMRRGLGVFISLDHNIFKVRISFLKGSNGKLLQRGLWYAWLCIMLSSQGAWNIKWLIQAKYRDNPKTQSLTTLLILFVNFWTIWPWDFCYLRFKIQVKCILCAVLTALQNCI